MDMMTCGELSTFTAEVGDAAAGAKLSYNWTVSAGTIKSGQGTSSISVDTTGLGGASLEATVQVAGLPEGCAGKAACATALICDPLDRKIDEYGNIAWSDEKARLDNFAIEMQNEPTARGYLICYGGKVGRAGEAQRRCRRAKNYVSGRRGIEASRIVAADGGYRENLTVELWVLPPGAAPPSASPTVDPREVRFIRGRPKGRARRR
jgi:PKD-like domain